MYDRAEIFLKRPESNTLYVSMSPNREIDLMYCVVTLRLDVANQLLCQCYISVTLAAYFPPSVI